jgi:hypothetical protein
MQEKNSHILKWKSINKLNLLTNFDKNRNLDYSEKFEDLKNETEIKYIRRQSILDTTKIIISSSPIACILIVDDDANYVNIISNHINCYSKEI